MALFNSPPRRNTTLDQFTGAQDHDWQENEKCLRCKRPISTMRRGTDFGMQRDQSCRCDVPQPRRP